VITTLDPMPMKLKKIMDSTTTCVATPSAATASSEMWATISVSTVPMSMRNPCSTKMGQANATNDS
jgi:hypothetical protein